ncbi:MAG: hypothetical protein JWN48_3016 [Myxococcaceae bacterium]|nr:hypothetical protein [Myxococcaceae bacterium]
MQELIYASAARGLLDPVQLGDILAVARRNNARLGVTGILLYHQGSFFQVLEGPPDVLTALYARIAQDPRHAHLVELRTREIERASFAAWSMGFVSLDPRLLSQLPGRHALSSNGTLRQEPEEVLALLDQFRQGQFRRYVLA